VEFKDFNTKNKDKLLLLFLGARGRAGTPWFLKKEGNSKFEKHLNFYVFKEIFN